MAETNGFYTLEVLSSRADYELICKMYDYLANDAGTLYHGDDFDLEEALADDSGAQSFFVNMDSAASVYSACVDIAPIILALQRAERTDVSLCIEGDIEEGVNLDSTANTAFRIDFKNGQAIVRKASYDCPFADTEEDDEDDEEVDLFFDPREEAYVEGHSKLDDAQAVDFFEYCDDSDLPDEELLDELLSIISGADE